MKSNEYEKLINDSKEGIIITALFDGKNVGYKKLDNLPFGKSSLISEFNGLNTKIIKQNKIIDEQNKTIEKLMNEITSLKTTLDQYIELNAKTEGLLLKTVESLNVRVSNLEVQMDETSNKIKYL